MQESDIPEVSALLDRCYTWLADIEDFSDQTLTYLTEVRGSAETIRKESQDQQYVVACRKVRIVGMMSIKNNEITKLYVDPLYHGKGIGTRLFLEAEQEIAQQGYNEIKLVALGNSPLHFYQSKGMIIKGKKISRVKELEGIVGTIMMKKISE